MLKSNNGPQTFLRFGLPRTKELLKDVSKVYNGIVVPANILLYQYKSTPAIVYSLNQPFFCDPMSYLFAQADRFKRKIEKGEQFKPSFEKLLIGYGIDPQFVLTQTRKLTDSLNTSQEDLESIIDNCFDFQINNVEKTLLEAEDLVDIADKSLLKPAFIIPPYFLYKKNSAESELNFKILEYCSKNKQNWPDSDIFPLLFIDQEDLNTDYLDTIMSKIDSYDFPGYCLWINNFEEKHASEEIIIKLITLINRLSKNKTKQIVMLYGGFYSLLLYHYGLSCICHGLLYSEHKDVNSSTSQSSGPAPVRYYLAELHQFLTLEKALVVLRKRPDLICECPICRRILQNDPENVMKFEGEENLAIMHFLYKRNEEKAMIGRLVPKDLIDYLEFSSSINNDLDSLKAKVGAKDKQVIDTGCLQNWSKAIKHFEDSLKSKS